MQYYCEGVNCYNSGGQVMLPPGLLCSGSPVSLGRIEKSPYPDWRKANHWRVTLATTRFCPASHLAATQTCFKQSGYRALRMDVSACCLSLSLFWFHTGHSQRGSIEDDRCRNRVAAPFLSRVIGWRPFLFHHSLTPGAHRENVDWPIADVGWAAIS